VGWALGGAFFGRVGDRLGRSRGAESHGADLRVVHRLSFFAQTWWHLLIFRFVAALGIGGEWAVGSTLLAETWPKRWRPWIAAVLQTGVNLGVLLACLTGYLLSGTEPRYVFLVGIVPALLVFWIRRHVPEPEEWHAAKASRQHDTSSIADLFRGPIARTTLLTIAVCACSLSGWWAFMFWHPQHLRHLPDVVALEPAAINRLVSTTFAAVIASSIAGNFFAGWVARVFGFRTAPGRVVHRFCRDHGHGLQRRSQRHVPIPLLAARSRILVGCLRPVHNVSATALPDPPAHHRSGLLLQCGPYRRRRRHRVLRRLDPGWQLPRDIVPHRVPLPRRGRRVAVHASPERQARKA
jgi:MFS family permease